MKQMNWVTFFAVAIIPLNTTFSGADDDSKNIIIKSFLDTKSPHTGIAAFQLKGGNIRVLVCNKVRVAGSESDLGSYRLDETGIRVFLSSYNKAGDFCSEIPGWNNVSTYDFAKYQKVAQNDCNSEAFAVGASAGTLSGLITLGPILRAGQSMGGTAGGTLIGALMALSAPGVGSIAAWADSISCKSKLPLTLERISDVLYSEFRNSEKLNQRTTEEIATELEDIAARVKRSEKLVRVLRQGPAFISQNMSKQTVNVLINGQTEKSQSVPVPSTQSGAAEVLAKE